MSREIEAIVSCRITPHKMESLEYIDAYFAGEFPPEEVSRFEKRIQDDPAFADEVAYYLGVLSTAREANRTERKERFRELYRKGAGTGRTATVRRMDGRKWLAVTAAAAVLAMVVLAWLLYLRPANPARLAERYIQQNLALLPVKMGSADSLATARGINLYNSGKFAEALQQYEEVLRSDSLNPTALNYAGIVSLRMENYDKALDYFIKLEHHTDPRVNPALFYEALTLLRRNFTGDSDHAKQLLRQIVENEWNRRADAQELLGKL